MSKKNNSGFTLIEILITIVILSVGILGVMTMQIRSMRSNAEARRVTESASWVADEFERLMLELSSELSADTLDTVRFALLSDSLQSVRSELQERLMDHLRQVHDELPAEGRHRLSRRMRNMIDGPMHGARHGREWSLRRGGLSRTKSDSSLKIQKND